MILAVERLAEVGGGMIAVADGEVLGAGRAADRGPDQRPAGRRGRRADTRALEAYRQLGSPVESPEMIFSFLSLGVIPALRLTNRGLVDGVEFELVPPLV